MDSYRQRKISLSDCENCSNRGKISFLLNHLVNLRVISEIIFYTLGMSKKLRDTAEKFTYVQDCLISTSYLAGLFVIFILLHVSQNCVCFCDS